MKYRPLGSVVLSIAIHLAIAAGFVHALVTPRYLDWLFTPRAEPEAPTERLRYVVMPPDRASASVAASQSVPRSTKPPVGRPITNASIAETRLLTPVAAEQTGGRIGADDRGRVTLVPIAADPRIWGVSAPHVAGEMSRADVLEGSLARAIQGSNDSIAALGVPTLRPAWVAGREGRRFGVGDDKIYIGKVSLPAVLVGMVPIPGFGCMPKMFFPDRPVRDSVGIICMQLENPGLAERAERVNEMSAEIRARAPLTTAAREEIDRIAARKDRERAARLRAQANAAAGGSTIPVRPPWR